MKTEEQTNPGGGRQMPHVVLFICDQLRADALGFMGNEQVSTPCLDRLARQGVVFENMFVQTPVCMGSRACLLTGRYLRSIRMGGGSPVLDPREITLAETLQRAGYRTGMFGKLHLTPQQYTYKQLKSDRPIADAAPFLEAAGLPPMPADPLKKNYGFQDVVGYEDGLWGEYKEWLQARDAKLAAMLPEWGMSKWAGWHIDSEANAALNDVGPTIIPPDLHPSTFIAESAARHFTENHSDHACFLHVSFVDPHHPFDPPEDILRNYSPADMPLPKYSDTGDLVWPDSIRERRTDFGSVTPALTRKTIACYYAMIEMVDRSIAKVIEAVEAAGEMENTIFVFIADHGEFLGDYGLFRKGAFHYDCLLRVPCLMCWNGSPIAPGRRLTGLCQEIDVAPTLLGLLGLPQTPGIQGIDLSTALLNDGDVGRPWTYTESYLALWGPYVDCWTVRTETAKLNYYPRDRRGHLFDLASDPGERRDLYSSAGHRELRDDMLATLIESVHSQADPLPRMISQF